MRVLTVGSAMVDTIAVIASDRIEQMTMRNADTSFLLLEEGRKTDALEVSTHCGGGAINAAVASARLGHTVSTLVKLGNDARAEMMLACLTAEGISSRWVRRDQSLPTGASVLVASHTRNAAIFTYRGANTLLVPDDLDDGAFDVDLVYIASLSNKSADCFPALVERAKRSGAMVAINPGIRQLSAKGGTLLQCLSSTDLLVMNRVEAEALVAQLVVSHGVEEGGPVLALEAGEELPEQARRPLTGGGYQVSVVNFLQALLRLGPRFVAMTIGRYGSLLGTRQEIIYCPAALERKPAGTAGAGDAFASTLAAALASQAPTEIAIRAAAINAAAVVGFVDTQTGLLDRKELDRRLVKFGDLLAIRRWPNAPYQCAK